MSDATRSGCYDRVWDALQHPMAPMGYSDDPLDGGSLVLVQGDLFAAGVTDEQRDRAFAVMALCPRCQFQVLTKRPERMAEYLRGEGVRDRVMAACEDLFARPDSRVIWGAVLEARDRPWPLPNVWLGTSAEDQKTADERIPHLLRCPAAVRFLSCEPLLGAVDLLRVDAKGFGGNNGHRVDCIRKGYWDDRMGFVNHSDMHDDFGPLHWVICGGESGGGARPCDVAWIRSIVGQCREAGVPVFVKQLGAMPCDPNLGKPVVDDEHLHNATYGYIAGNGVALPLNDPKGGDMGEWPEDLRVREMPKAYAAMVKGGSA